MRSRASCVIALALVLSPAALQAQSETISQLTDDGEMILWHPLTYAQVFTTPVAAVFMESFSFWFSGVTTAYSLSIVEWGLGMTGSTLWTSADQPDPGPPGAFAKQDVLIPNIAVAGNTTYLAYLRSAGGAPLGTIRGNSSGGYPGGQAVLFNSPLAVGVTPSAGTWDMKFEAQFGTQQVAPEPATVFLLATGLLGIGGVGLARRRKQHLS